MNGRLPPFPVLYRDEYLAAVVKPSGLAMHKGLDASEDPLLQLARRQLGTRIWLPHRLDRGTSGVVVLALDPQTAAALGKQFEERTARKRYFALVRGALSGEHVVDRPVLARGASVGLSARTRLVALATAGTPALTAVELHPETGRRHQLRLHARHLRHPLVGDTTYGDGAVNRRAREELGLHRLALHALELTIEHPATAYPITFTAPLPADLCHALDALGMSSSLPRGWLAPSSEYPIVP